MKNSCSKRVAETARGYGLPSLPTVLRWIPKRMSSSASIASRKRMEFRDGDEFIQFSPTAIRLHEDEREEDLPATGVLCGWALDDQGHLCAVYRSESGFQPPAHLKLLHFLPAPVSGESYTTWG